MNAYLVKAPLVSATYSACAASNKMDIRKKGSAESHVEDIVKHRRGMRTSNSLPSLAPSGVAGASLSFRPSSPPSPPPSLQSSQLCNNPRVTSTGHAPVMPSRAHNQRLLEGVEHRQPRFLNDVKFPTHGSRMQRNARPSMVAVHASMRYHGWTRSGKLSIWTSEARRLALWRVSCPAQVETEVDLALHQRLHLLQCLEDERVPQGLKAFKKALELHCDVDDLASPSPSNEDYAFPVLAFAGRLALLGFDVPTLCGFNEYHTWSELGSDKEGLLLRARILGIDCDELPLHPVCWCEASQCIRGTSGSRGQNSSMHPEPPSLEERPSDAAIQRWITFSRFVALSAWFFTQPSLRRRGRLGGSSASVGNACTAHANDMSDKSASTLEILQEKDAERCRFVPNENDLHLLQAAVQIEFDRHAKVSQFGVLLLARSDLFHYIVDYSPKNFARNPQVRIPTSGDVGRIYDEVLDFQMHETEHAGRLLSKGLTFASFRLALLKIAVLMDLHFQHLVDDAIEGISMSNIVL